VRRRNVAGRIFRLPLTLACLAMLVVGLSFSPQRNLRASASRQLLHAPEEQTSSGRPARSLAESVSKTKELSATRPSLLKNRIAESVSTLSKTPAQQEARGAPDALWQELNEKDSARSRAENRVLPKSYRRLRLNQAARAQLLRRAPLEFTKAAVGSPLVMTLPMPNGAFSRFLVEESPIMEAALAARFPEIKTYRGRGIDDRTATARFDWTPKGLHAIVLSAQGTVFVEPFGKGETNDYVSYYKRDAPDDADAFKCSPPEVAAQLPPQRIEQAATKPPASQAAGALTSLRTYRLAIAATAEYTQTYGGGTIGGSLAAITTTINLVNAIYERDLAIRLILVAGEDAIIFTNPAADGLTSDAADTMFNESQGVIDSLVGSGNYDIGHVFDGHLFTFTPGRYFFQGRGNLASACAGGRKAQGVSIFRSLEPSATSAVYVVAHEMGHQFGASHTFNGTTTSDCGGSRVAASAYEPGTGSTIMGYRGTGGTNFDYIPLCGAEDLHSIDTYFHAASIEQINNYTTFGQGSFCPARIETANHTPEVKAGASYTIPQSTPFTLTATGSDMDNDALTYCWEEFDLGAAGPPNTDNGNRPIFRSFAPVANPARTFPQLSDILSGVSTFGESLPQTTRAMNFRVTARDNHPGGGGVQASAAQVNVYAGSGPFIVTQPGFNIIWAAGSTQTVTWDVAGTSSAPINCAAVRILLSIDGGNTFPITLAESAPNNGAANITVPNIATTTARVKVEAIGNIFFNVSVQNFNVTPPVNTAPPVLLTEENTNRAVALDSVTFMRDPFPLTTANNFSADHRTRITLFAVNLELLASENISVVTAQAEDAAHNLYPLQVEYAGKVPAFDWLTQVVVKLPNAPAGDLWVTVSLRDTASNKALVGIK
jgi:hypothetical protein